jgi:aldehyde:ferredoxin oxidoreductase
LIFSGISEKPVYAYVEDGKVSLHDASDLWGEGTKATIAHFKEVYGEKDLTVITIGQAGENQVKFAAWLNENERAAGRGGTGAGGRTQEAQGNRRQGDQTNDPRWPARLTSKLPLTKA